MLDLYVFFSTITAAYNIHMLQLIIDDFNF
jgi:hypothetical protein